MKRVSLAAVAALLAFPLLVGTAIADDPGGEPETEAYQAEQVQQDDSVALVDQVEEVEQVTPDVDLDSIILALFPFGRNQLAFSSAAVDAVAVSTPDFVSNMWWALTAQDDKGGKGTTPPPRAAAPTGGGDQAAPATPLGYTLYPKAGFGLALPNDWTEIDLSRSPEQIVAALPPFSPDPQIDQNFKRRLTNRIAGLQERDFSFYGFDFEVDGVETDATVLSRPIPQGTTLDQVTEVWTNILEDDPNVVGPISREHVVIPAGPAVLIGYDTQAGTVADRAITVPTVDLLVLRTTGPSDELYVLTFSTVVEPDDPEYDATIDTIVQIIGTFHFR